MGSGGGHDYCNSKHEYFTVLRDDHVTTKSWHGNVDEFFASAVHFPKATSCPSLP
jgi:hypothetical protein